MSAIHINKENFQQEVLHSDKPVLVDFWASWCGPCQMVLPIMDEIADERSDIKVCKINVDEQKELARQFRVMSIPTLAVFKKRRDGKPLYRRKTKGADPTDDLNGHTSLQKKPPKKNERTVSPPGSVRFFFLPFLTFLPGQPPALQYPGSQSSLWTVLRSLRSGNTAAFLSQPLLPYQDAPQPPHG